MIFKTIFISGARNIAELFGETDFYTINSAYLLLTLCIECPIVYGLFADELKNKKEGIGVIALANIITTILVIAIERISCRGK